MTAASTSSLVQQKEKGFSHPAIPAGGCRGCMVRRGKDVVQVVIQQLLMYNA
jgi:hypothetical protein